MKYYRNLQPFKIISFDLDDTLYDNSNVIWAAEQAFIEHVKNLSQLVEFNAQYWHEWKEKVAQVEPILCENVTEWRKLALTALLQHHQKNKDEIDRTLTQAMDMFLQWRHKIAVPEQSFSVLTELRKHYQLSVITNGNVEPSLLGFHQFDLVLHGGKQGRAKPHRQLFEQTADYFQISPAQILHVGDNLITDVQGATQAQCQSVWLNESSQPISQFLETRVLPTLEINQLTELLDLI